MSEKLPFHLDLPALPDRRQLVEHYIGTLTDRDRGAADNIAAQLYNPERALADCQVLIPVAAHQESTQIQNTLAQYAHQQTDQPFSVILSLNSPATEQLNPGVNDTLQQIELARAAHPDLDLRTALTFYDTPTIGLIRRDLWNGALIASTYSGAYDDPNDDIIGINHDIDAIAISPRYINRIQRYYRNQKRHYNRNGLAKAPLSPSSTVITHALSTDHPNISKAVQWADFTTRQLDAAYEAGLVFPLSHYAHAGGFQASDQTYETGTLCRNTALPRIPSTTMQTSPRRYIDRIQHGYAKMWSSETFGPNDDCRTSTTRPDITQKQLEDTISADDQIKAVLAAVSSRAIQHHINRMTARHRSPVASEPGQQESIDDIIRQLDAIGTQRRARGQAGEIFDKKARLFTAVLGRVIQSPTLATQVEALQIDKKFRRETLRPFDY